MTPAVWITSTEPREIGEQPIQIERRGADRRRRAGRVGRQRSQGVGLDAGPDERPDLAVACPAARRIGERVHQRSAEPAGGAGTIVTSGSFDHDGGLDEAAGIADRDGHDRGLRVHARCVGQQRRVVDVHVDRAVDPAEAVGGGDGSIVAHRDGRAQVHGHHARRVAVNLPVISARSARERTIGADANDGYTSRAPASSITSASRARP